MKQSISLRQAWTSSLNLVIGLALFVAVWGGIKDLGNLPAYLLPSPLEVLQSVQEHFSSLVFNAGVTGLEVMLGFALATVLGLSLAVAIQFKQGLGTILWPVVLIAQITPQIAFAPALIIWLGLGLSSKVVIAGLIAFFPILINASAGFRSIDPASTDLARSMLASRWDYHIRFEWPSALPYILSGLKIAMTYAVVGAVVAEFISSNDGLGNAILVGNGALDTAYAIAAVATLSLVGVTFFAGLSILERALTPWHVSFRQPQVTPAGI